MKTLRMIALAGLFAAPLSMADVVVIAHPNGPDNLSENDVRDLYLNRSNAATPFEIAKGSDVRREFHDWITGRSNSQLQSFWAEQTFTGEGQPPAEVSDSARMVDEVAATPNSVGYADPADVDDSVEVILKR
ncbi:phosphate ABC transporter substrate-binding protein [Halospina sp. K52047b]|uniref:phosphate ABC transporter substrate-binding protein n=1 Tax=Halospina sp. K52047b TaxID=2614160 RepID=UPI00124AD705|nr:phosphate ABC transporter substrate-binding protein [Halospina sp. K52047b]KAA8983328.1 phosphate ABC transporter substrate-binding protein [Halospina sp. K52047b]